MSEVERQRALIKAMEQKGTLGGSGHYRGNDRRPNAGGPRSEMGEYQLKNVLKLLSLGAKKVNLKVKLFNFYRKKHSR